MAAPDPQRLFCLDRFGGESTAKDRFGLSFLSLDPIRTALEEDRLRVALCPPVRRMQQKTQVFPLDVKASTRSRLTHSMEVIEYTRLIALSLGGVSEFFASRMDSMLLCLHNASLLHDIGNPPFGHFGEVVIRDFLDRQCDELGSRLTPEQSEDLRSFNGNAQSLRLIHSIQKLDLTCVQIASILKVPHTPSELKEGQHREGYDRLHAGAFLSELPLLDRIRQARGSTARHFLATVLELGDDLSYALADIEDAYDRELVKASEIIYLTERLVEDDPRLAAHFSRDDIAKRFRENPSGALVHMRDTIVRMYLEDITSAARKGLEGFIDGGHLEFGEDSLGYCLVGKIKAYDLAKVYRHRDVEELELGGAHYLNTLFGMYRSLLAPDREGFLAELGGRTGNTMLSRLARRISRRHRDAYLEKSGGEDELYYRVRLIVDYISGMTDTYAKSEYNILTGQN